MFLIEDTTNLKKNPYSVSSEIISYTTKLDYISRCDIILAVIKQQNQIQFRGKL